jgi:CheY-like chemotaxis protein
MPFGSAASLPGTPPQAPLSPFPVTRRHPRFTVVPHNWGDAAPPRIVPLQKAADDPPRGWVLLAEDDAASAREAQRLLRESGYRVLGPAASTAEANRLIDRALRPLSCGLLDLDMDDADSIADRLAARDIPVVWLLPTANAALPSAHAAAPVLHRPFGRDALIDALEMARQQGARQRYYVTPPPQAAWPRVFPQL